MAKENDIQFRFHPVCGEDITISDDRLRAEKKGSSSWYGVAYGAKPLLGTSEFEVELTDYINDGWFGSLALGVFRCVAGTDLKSVATPAYTWMAPGYCVWMYGTVYNYLDGREGKPYNRVTLNSLRTGDRVGLRLSFAGDLVFTVNGERQGVAATCVYRRGYDVYAVVEHYGPHPATRIVRSALDIAVEEVGYGKPGQSVADTFDVSVPMSGISSADTDSSILNQALEREDFRHHFDEAMKHGYVTARLIVLLLIGAAGAGKTHAKHLFLGLPPPPIRQSTPLAEEAIRAISTLRAMVSGTTGMVWNPVTLEGLKQMIAEAVKAGETQGYSRSTESSTGEPNGVRQPHSSPEATSQADYSEPSQEAPPLVQPSRRELEKELVDLVMSSSGSRKLFDVDWVYLVDSGGQPSFHEILALFVRIASAVAFVIKLNERLSDKPTVESYGKDGRKYSSYSSPFTNEEILRHCIRGMSSRRSSSQGETGPKILVVGTYKDLEDTCDETRKEKNSTLLKMLRPLFKENLAYFSIANPEELIFPVNAKEPKEKEDGKVAEQFRRAVSKCSEARVTIPLAWYVLEQYIRVLADELCRKVLRTSECVEEAKKLHMKDEACEAALVYLDKLNMFFYRPDQLKGLVFCGSQVWLDKITELSELIDRLQDRSEASPGSAETQAQLPSLRDPTPSEPSDSAPCGTVVPPATEPPVLATHGNSSLQSIGGWASSLFQTQPQPQVRDPLPVDPPVLQVSTDASPGRPHSPSEDPLEDLHIPLQTDSDESHSSRVAFPDLSEFCDSEGIKFRDHGIVTVNILRKFPRHYVEGLFTPAELLKLLTAFLVTAPISEGSLEYVMPCLLRELAPHKLDKHRQLDPSSPAAPLLIQFPDNWVPAGVFTVLIAYLQSLAHWELCRSSGSPDCLHRNCANFYLPTRHGGSVTLVDSFEYLEVHVVDASDRACQKACPRIVEDIFHGIGEAASRLHYGTLQLAKAFLCPTPTPACQVDPHLANLVDDELVCSVSRRKTGEPTNRHKVWPLSVDSKEDNPLLERDSDDSATPKDGRKGEHKKAPKRKKPKLMAPEGTESSPADPDVPSGRPPSSTHAAPGGHIGQEPLEQRGSPPTLSNEPKMHEFTYLENPTTGASVEIIKTIQAQWPQLVDLFRLPSYTVANLSAQPHHTPGAACREVFHMWLNGDNTLLMPKNWNTVIKVMGRLDNAKLGQDIKRVLTGQ